MLSKLSDRIANVFVRRKIISETEKELYVYGLFMLLSHSFFFGYTIIVGLILSCALESLVFFVEFQLIRHYAGGYHASKEVYCDILSSLSLLLSIIVIKTIEVTQTGTLLLVVTGLSVVVIGLFSPLDTEEKLLLDFEKLRFRKMSWLILIAESVVIIISAIADANRIMVPSCVSLIFESLLLISGKIKLLSTKTKDAVS